VKRFLMDSAGLAGPGTREKRAHNRVLRVPLFVLHNYVRRRPKIFNNKAVMEWPGALSIPFLVEIQTLELDFQQLADCRRLPQSCGEDMLGRPIRGAALEDSLSNCVNDPQTVPACDT